MPWRSLRLPIRDRRFVRRRQAEAVGGERGGGLGIGRHGGYYRRERRIRGGGGAVGATTPVAPALQVVSPSSSPQTVAQKGSPRASDQRSGWRTIFASDRSGKPGRTSSDASRMAS